MTDVARGTRKFDVVVVGGGPAGATTGTILAKENISVAILDKAGFPRDKPCGGFVTGRSAQLLRSLYGEDAFASFCRFESDGCRMYYRDRLVAEARNAEPNYFTARREMDYFLLDAARRSGCHVFEGCDVSRADVSRSVVTLRSGEEFEGRVIVGADGARSAVRRSCWATTKSKRHKGGFGLVAEVPADSLRCFEGHEAFRQLSCIFFGVVPWGYGWTFPKGDIFSVGVGGLTQRKMKLRQHLQWLIERHFRNGVWEKTKISGHTIPFGDFERKPGRRNVILVGDAAGLVEPITGEGIAYALESGVVAAKAIARALSLGSPAMAGRLYLSLLRPAVLKHLKQALRVRWLLFSKPCLPVAMHVMSRHPRVVESYLELLSGKLSYPAYFRRMFASLVGFRWQAEVQTK